LFDARSRRRSRVFACALQRCVSFEQESAVVVAAGVQRIHVVDFVDRRVVLRVVVALASPLH